MEKRKLFTRSTLLWLVGGFVTELTLFVILDVLYVNKINVLTSLPTFVFWLLVFLIFAPFYFWIFYRVTQSKYASILLAILNFMLMTMISVILVLLIHVEILKAPL